MSAWRFAAALLVGCSITPAVWGQGFGGSERIGTATGCVAIAQVPGDRTRIFVLTLQGRVFVVQNGVQLADPFINVNNLDGPGNGATGLAFDPDYASNGFVYLAQTARDPSGIEPAGMTVWRFRVSGDNPNMVDSLSRAYVIVTQPATGQHTGGWIGFGPDGYLYVTGGDAGGTHLVQDKNSWIGKLLRLNVQTDAFPADARRNYGIPPNNPFAGQTPGADEVWSLGWRNAFRASFDRNTGDLWVADVGQSLREEVNREPAGHPGGLNYGWPCREGHVAGPSPGACPANAEFAAPLDDFVRNESSCIIGGYVYRGCANPGMRGRYVFGNCSSTTVRSLDPSRPTVSQVVHTGQLGQASTLFGFGEDLDGELYFCGQGGVFKLLPAVESGGTDCNANGRIDECEIARGEVADANGDGLPDDCTARCRADADASGSLGVGDVFRFLGLWFSNSPFADFNSDPGVTLQDLFDFLSAYFSGCP